MHGCREITALSPAVDAMTMRRVCGNYATGVAIVSTVRADGSPCALTVNSFTSVSLDPPLILWSLRAESPSLSHFESDGPFAVSILGEGQDELAMRFARPTGDKFDGVAHRAGSFGAPIIEDCVAHLECLPYNRVDAGDHVIFIWQVIAADHMPAGTPLAFYNGKFHSVSPLDEPSLARPQVA